MKILYFTKPFYLDSDLPYLKEQKNNGVNIYTIIDLPTFFLKSSILNIETQIPKPGIINASLYEEFKLFEDYLDLEKTFIINRVEKKALAFSNLILNFKLFYFVFKNKFDLIHTTFFYDIAEFLLYYFRKKTVITVHDPFPHLGETNKRKTIFRYLGFKLLHNFILLNKTQLNKFVNHYGMNKKRIHTNTLGTYSSFELFKPLQLYDDLNFILFFGRVSPYKGIEYLLEAMLEVNKEFKNVKLIVAGSGTYHFDISKFQDLEFIKIINRYITNSELVSLISKAKFVICPYLTATQSGVIMTSFNFGVPVIATNVGGLSETVIHGKNGLLIPPKNVKKMSESIISLLTDEKKIIDMRKDIESNYFLGNRSWFSISRKYKEIYKNILDKNLN